MLIDCFIFYNEIDMLAYRLKILSPIVDYFILVEATHTHTGILKPLFYDTIKNTDKFINYNAKIIHVIIKDMPHIAPNININNNEQ